MRTSVLSELFYLFGNLFRMYLIYQFLKAFFVAKGEKNVIVLRYLLFAAFFAGNSLGFLYFHISPEAVLLSNLIGVFLITLSYNGSWKYRIYATLIIVSLCVLCEDLIYKLVLQFHLTYINAISVAVSDLLLLMIVLIFQTISSLWQGEDIKGFEWMSIIFVPTISIILSVATLDKCADESAATIGGIGILLLNIFVFYIFDHLAKLYRKQAQLMALDAQNQAYQKQLDVLGQTEERISALRHDMNNHLTMIQHLARQEDKQELKQYVHEIKHFIQPKEYFVSTGDTLVDGMLNLKLDELITDLQAEVECDVQLQTPGAMDRIDISILLGNLLDNAIQALSRCELPRKLKFTMEEKRGLLYVQIKNNHHEKIQEKNGSFLTTKEDRNNHGMGLKNVKRIAEKYQGEMAIDYDESWFSVEILLFLDNAQ